MATVAIFGTPQCANMPFKEGVLHERLSRMEWHEDLCVTRAQYAALRQFADSGPYVASIKSLHEHLQNPESCAPHACPRPAINLHTLRNILCRAKTNLGA